MQAEVMKEEKTDTIPLKAIHHVHFWVGNAKQAAYYYRTAFGFRQVAYSGLETGNRECTSYVLTQGDITFVLSSPLTPEHPMNQHIAHHGDGVQDIAFLVDDVDHCIAEAKKKGAKVIFPPCDESDDFGSVRRGAIATYGDTIHSFISTENYRGCFLPLFREQVVEGTPCGIHFVDHMVANVELGKMDTWVSYYRDILGFNQLLHFDDEDISTEYSALMSKVMQNGTGRIKFPINEPAEGKRKSQIEEYLDYYGGPGVQHIAMKTDDILSTVRQLKENGVEFLRVPDTYYEALLDRVGEIDEPVNQLQELGILVDRDDEGYLLQIFTQPVEDRPTLFYEIIQRKGCQGFGEGNFKALFEAIERAQLERGNL